MSDDIQYSERMSNSDSLMWSIEKDPLLRSTITTAIVLDGPVDHGRLEHTMDRASRIVPRLRQRVRGNPYSVAPPRWEVDPSFDLRYHLRWTRWGGKGSLEDLLLLAEPIAMQGFDRARPLWEVMVVEDLDEGRSGLILKIHHSITDGVGGVRIMLELFDFDRDAPPREPMPDAPEVHVLNPAERFAHATTFESRRQLANVRRRFSGVTASLTDPARTARRAADSAGSLARFFRTASEPLSPLMRGRSLSQHFETMDLPLEDLKVAGRRAGGRLNDAFVGGVTGGLRRYHIRHDRPVDALRMAMPINVRDASTESQAGNQFVPARIEIPIAIEDPIERMQAIRAIVETTRQEAYLTFSDQVAGLVNRLPTTLTTTLFGSMLRTVDFTTSNVPGSPVDLYIGGARVEAQYALGPIAGAASNITLFSYGPNVHIGFNTDPAAVTDPEGFMKDMHAGFEEILG